MGATRRFSLALMVTFVGLALATLWEMFEWVENQYAPASTHVGYDDTISDLVLGGTGSLVAGLCLVFWYHRRGRRDSQRNASAAGRSGSAHQARR